MIKALIFDVDGTIAETEELHREAFNDIFLRHNLGWNWSIKDYTWLLKTTGGKERMRKYADHLNAQISDATIAHLHKEKTARYVELMAKGKLQPRAGIVDLMSLARNSGLKIAVATTTSLPNVEILARALFDKSPYEMFDAVAAGDMVKAKKPAPDVYALALSQLGLNCNECIAFEDTNNGVRSALGAGLPVVLSQTHYSKDEPTHLATYVVDDFSNAVTLPPLRFLKMSKALTF